MRKCMKDIENGTLSSRFCYELIKFPTKASTASEGQAHGWCMSADAYALTSYCINANAIMANIIGAPTAGHGAPLRSAVGPARAGSV